MKEITKVYIPVILCLVELCYLRGKVQAERTIPILQIDAKNLKQNEWLNLVKDKKTENGWYVNIKKFIPKNISATNLEIIIQTKGSSDQSYKEVMEFRFCDMLNGYKTFEIVSKDILNMIIPGNQWDCNIKKSMRPMVTAGFLNLDFIENAGHNFPEPPFKMIADVRFLHKTTYKFESSGGKRIKEEDTLFQVYYDVGKNTTFAGQKKSSQSTSSPIPKTTAQPKNSK